MKTIGVKIYFWTNDLPERVGVKKEEIPFWEGGQVYLEANADKGIESQNIIFNSMEELPSKIKILLAKAKLVGVRNFGDEIRASKRNAKKQLQ